MVRGKTKKIKLYSNPQQANYEVYWTSEDSSITKVMSDGTVKAKKKGKRKNICRHILMMENFMTIYNGQLP